MNVTTVIMSAIAEIIKLTVPALIVFKILDWNGEQVSQFILVTGVFLTSITTVIIAIQQSKTVSKDIADAQILTAVKMPETTSVAEVKAATEEKLSK